MNNKLKKVYVLGGQMYDEYANWILPMGFEITRELSESDLILACGGEDVTPSLYSPDRPPHYTVSSNFHRDKREIEILAEVIKEGKPILGVCRGSQLGSCFANGFKPYSLVQHQGQPGYQHEMFTKEGDVIVVSSSHHQAQNPFNLPKEDYILLGWTEGVCGQRWWNHNEMVDVSLPEVEEVYYRRINYLALQHHGEYCYPTYDKNSKKYIARCQKLLSCLMEGNFSEI